MSTDLRQVVKHNLDVARRILFVFEMKKRLDELPRIFPRSLSPIRDFLSQRMDEVKDASLPLVLVFVASCLEHYLREKIPIEKKEKLGFKKLIERFRSSIGDKLAKDAHEMRIKRNIILHKAGVIDEKASKEFMKIGLTAYSVGDRLMLSEDEIRRYIDTCEKICNLI